MTIDDTILSPIVLATLISVYYVYDSHQPCVSDGFGRPRRRVPTYWNRHLRHLHHARQDVPTLS